MRWLSLCALALSSLASAQEVTQADYELYYRGISAGTVTVTVSRDTLRTYYEAKATPGTLARLFGQGTIIERGTVEANSLRPLEYFYHNVRKEEFYKYVYDWEHRQVVIATEEGESTQPLTEGTQDPVSMALRMLLDLPDLPPNYSVLSRGKLQVYRFRSPVPDPLKVLGEVRNTLRVERQRGDSRDTRIFSWHDAEQNYWMVKTVRMEEGSEKIRLELLRYQQDLAPH